MTQEKKPKYGGQTTCGHPYCAPDPELVQRLDATHELLPALERVLGELLSTGRTSRLIEEAIEQARNAIDAAEEGHSDPIRVVPDPALTEAAWRIVRRRMESGSYEDEYRTAFERLHRLVPLSTREAQAAEEVIEVEVKRLADALEGATQDFFAESHFAKMSRIHDKVGRRELPHWKRSGP